MATRRAQQIGGLTQGVTFTTMIFWEGLKASGFIEENKHEP